MKHLLISLKSWFSFRHGVESPRRLAATLSGSGFSGGVLADRNLVSGQLEFNSACLEHGVTPGAGVEIDLSGVPVLFIAMRSGWPQLCRMVTSFHIPGRIAPEEALGLSDRLVAVTRNPDDAEFIRSGKGFRGDIFVGIPPACQSGVSPVRAEKEVINAGWQPLAVWFSMFSSAGSIETYRVLRRGYRAMENAERDVPYCSMESRMIPDIGTFSGSFSGAGRSLKMNSMLAEVLSAEPAADDNGRPGNPDDNKRLNGIVRTRLGKMYRGSPTAVRRTEMELETICENGLAGYFLRFFDIVEYCRNHGIAISARGSAGGSVLSYLLGLSIVCPIRHDLSFARFFNRLRSSPPDIDLDIDSARRDEVIEWFLERAGRNGAAVSQIVTHRKRSAFRVAAAGLGIGNEEMDTLSKHRDSAAWRSPIPARALVDSELLRGLPSHLAPHPCGIVCTDTPVDLIVPLQLSPNGYHITQFDKDGVEEIGLLKMDLLGQRGLTTISGVCSILGKVPQEIFRRGGDIPEPARRLLDSGRSIGVVHVESPAMRGLLKDMRIRTMEDVARSLALVRPGASAGGGRRRYLECLRSGTGRNQVFPELDPHLRENLGIMLYQEDVSRAAEVLLGIDEASSDLLRRKLKKKEIDREEVISLCRSMDMSPAKACAVWTILSGYAGYGFCKAHAFTYGAVACAAAALKAEHPALYMASVMAAGGGFYGSRVYLEEARRLGVKFQPPGVNTGKWLTWGRNGKIIPGFHHLRGMGSVEYEKLKEGRPYRYPSDVLAAGGSMALCRNMAAAGCFREIGFNPPAALLQLEAGDGGFFPGISCGTPELPDYSRRTRVAMELGLMGLPLVTSPLELADRPAGTMPAENMPLSGETRIWGRFVTGRRLAAGAGFLMLEDNTGVADVFLPSPHYRIAQNILVRPEATLIVRGRIESGGRIKAALVEAGPLLIEPLEPEAPGK